MSLNNNPATKKPTPSGTTDSPYLGSKISLVSKAKIRYEGILYTIDANESTVALSKVRSFGTEDRPTDRPVPPRDEIFEYIIFRGADIEDLQVREPPQTSLPQDPAIVESSMYPSTGRSAGSATLSGPGASNSNNLSSPSVPTGSNKSAKPSSNNDPLRQLNTQPTSRSFYQQQQQQGDGQDYSYGNQRRSGRQQQDYYNDQRRTGSGKYGYAEWPRTNNSAWENNNYRQPQSQQQQQQQRYPRQQQQQQQNYDNNRFYPNRRQQQQQQQQQQSNGGYQGGNRERRNSTGGMTGSQQRNHRQRADSTRGNANNQSALKFIGDFDFEKSNAEFDKNAIEDEIKKSLSIKTSKDKTDESTATEQQQKENVPAEQNPAPIQPTSSTTAEKPDRSDQDANSDGFYDKQRSFFDRISCETTEKEKTNNARRNWNEERRLNAETFGLRYRPAQQGGNQRNPGGYNNYNNYNNNNQRRGYSGGGGGGGGGGGQQQSFYGNGARYQRGGGGGGGGGGQQRGRNNTYYNNNNNNNNNRMRAY